MKKSVGAILALAAFGTSFLAADSALATKKITFKGTVGQVKAACDRAQNAGDEVSSYPTTNSSGQVTGHTCENFSNGNAVHCDNAGNCTGTINTGRSAGKVQTGRPSMQDILTSGGAAQ